MEWKMAEVLMPFRRLEKKLGYDDYYSTLNFADRYNITLYAERDIRRKNPEDGKLYICCGAPHFDINGEIEEPTSKLHFDACQIAELAESETPPPELVWSPLGNEDNGNLSCLRGEAVRADLKLTPKQFDQLFWNNELEEAMIGYVDKFSYEQYCKRNGVVSELLNITSTAHKVTEPVCPKPPTVTAEDLPKTQAASEARDQTTAERWRGHLSVAVKVSAEIIQNAVHPYTKRELVNLCKKHGGDWGEDSAPMKALREALPSEYVSTGGAPKQDPE